MFLEKQGLYCAVACVPNVADSTLSSCAFDADEDLVGTPTHPLSGLQTPKIKNPQSNPHHSSCIKPSSWFTDDDNDRWTLSQSGPFIMSSVVF